MAEGSSFLRCLRWFVFLFNLIFWMVGLVMLGIGLWLLFDPVYISLSENPKISIILFVAAGVVIALLGFLGCLGALRESPCLLTTYFIVLFIVFILQLVAAVLAFQHQDKLRTWLEKSMYDIVYNKYGQENEYTSIIDSMQTGLSCCGVHSYRDWLHSYYSHGQSGSVGRPIDIGIGASGIGRTPHSCCNNDGLRDFPTPPEMQLSNDDRAGNVCGVNFNRAPLWTYEAYLHPQGCSQALYNKLWFHLDIVITAFIIIGIIELIAMIVTMLLCCNISKRNSDDLKHGGYY